MRENATEKALRILREQRLEIERVDPHGGTVVARCEGDNDVYMLGYDAMNKEWRCTCVEPFGRCSHLLALKTLVKR